MANVDTLYKNQFGQLGCIFSDTTGEIKPPTNKVFVAIQIIDNAKFTALVADISNKSLGYVGTPGSIHDGSTQSVTLGTGGDAMDSSNQIPKGMTIFGRWTALTLSEGAVIAYIGN